MTLDGLSCVELAKLTALRLAQPDIDTRPGQGCGLAFGFLRAIDVYNADLPADAYRRLAKYAALAGARQPSPHEALEGVLYVAIELLGWKPERDLADAFMASKCSHARAVGMTYLRTFARNRLHPFWLESIGLSLFWMLRAAGRLDLAAEVFRRMLGAEIHTAVAV